MSYASSIMYSASLADRTRTFQQVRSAIMAKPNITITLKGESEQTLPFAYSTRDKIEGEVTIISPHDIRFDDIYITFEGQVRVWTELYQGNPAMGSSRHEVLKTFLKMNQPIDENLLPTPRIALKGVSYTFPFSFVVPEQMLDSQCSHNLPEATSTTIRQRHLQLPPTLGTGRTISHDNTLQLDDVAPDMTKIKYNVRVRLCRRREVDSRQTVICDETRQLLVIPVHPELPPVAQDKTFVFRKEKDIRKGLFKGKLGKLIVSADQPKHLEVKTVKAALASTVVPVYVEFYPINDTTEPPKLNSMSVKLKCRTHFSTRHISYTPQRKSQLYDPQLSHYEESMNLSTRQLTGVKWLKRGPGGHRDSGYGSMMSRRDSDESGSTSSISTSPISPTTTFFTAEILVPVVQPKEKGLTPTFESCYISRSYELDVTVSFDASARMSTSMQLKLPIQVTAVGNPDRPHDQQDEELPAFEEFFTPRSVVPPAGVPVLSDLPLEEYGTQLPSHMLSNRPNMPPPPGYGALPEVSEQRTVRVPMPIGIAMRC